LFIPHKDLEAQKLCLFLARFWWEKDEKVKNNCTVGLLRVSQRVVLLIYIKNNIYITLRCHVEPMISLVGKIFDRG
jgi:hypothetical protein